MSKPIEPEFIESTAGQVAAEPVRRGIAPEKRVTVTIEPDEPHDWLTKTRNLRLPKSAPKARATKISTASSRKSVTPFSRRSDEAGSRYQCLCQRRAEGEFLAGAHHSLGSPL